MDYTSGVAIVHRNPVIVVTAATSADIICAQRNDKMPHIVPITDEFATPTADQYANAYANAFDLSLLPHIDDGQQHQQFQQQSSEAEHMLTTVPSVSTSTSSINIAHPHRYEDFIPTSVFQHFDAVKLEQPVADNANDTTFQVDQFFTIYPPSPTPSHDSAVHLHTTSNHSKPSNNSGSYTAIKQEYCHTLYPPSPPDSYGSVSPGRCYSEHAATFGASTIVKGEHFGPLSSSSASSLSSSSSVSSADLSESSIDIDSLLGSVVGDIDLDDPQLMQHQSNQQQQQHQQQQQQQQDHQLLREFLQDTTFQRRHNLKPLPLDALLMAGGWGDNGDDCGGADGDIGPVISLALEHARKDVQRTCEALQISADPQHWTTEHVQSWLRSTIAQFGMSVDSDLQRLFPENGAALVRLSEAQFVDRLPQNGGTLHAQLEVWKAACNANDSSSLSSNSACYNILEMIDTIENLTAMDVEAGSHLISPSMVAEQQPWSPLAEQRPSSAAADLSEDDDEDDDDIDDDMSPTLHTDDTAASPEATAVAALVLAEAKKVATPSSNGKTAAGVTKSGGRQGGAHIHLWQFLKELLADVQQHGSAIRWLDRAKGVFKIEDSVRVARLWGRRKNRPAMNYDKLSRSIRQYYKKGIMKKTERSQRLVYQFCHPYCL